MDKELEEQVSGVIKREISKQMAEENAPLKEIKDQLDSITQEVRAATPPESSRSARAAKSPRGGTSPKWIKGKEQKKTQALEEEDAAAKAKAATAKADAAPIRYTGCNVPVYAPSYADSGPFKAKPPPPSLLSAPHFSLQLEKVHGCRGGTAAQYLKDGRIIYTCAALVVIQEAGDSGEQVYFDAHSNAVTALAVHPDGVTVATGAAGKVAPIFVWTSDAEKDEGSTLGAGSILSTLGLESKESHMRKIGSLDFSHDGHFLVSLGGEDRPVAMVWDWRVGQLLAKAVTGTQRVYSIRFNPYQAIAFPEREPVSGEALKLDEAAYCLASVGLHHCKCWVLHRRPIPPRPKNKDGEDIENEEEEKEIKGFSLHGRRDYEWHLESGTARLEGRGELKDFTSLAFVNDNSGMVVGGEVVDELDRCASRIVVGAASGDLYIIQQPVKEVRVSGSDKDKATEQPPWWEQEEGKGKGKGKTRVGSRMWVAYGELCEMLPCNDDVGTKYLLETKASERLAVITRQLSEGGLGHSQQEKLEAEVSQLRYSGPLSGHSGRITCVAYDESLGQVITCGADGCVRRWAANSKAPKIKVFEAGPSLQMLDSNKTTYLSDCSVAGARMLEPGCFAFSMVCEGGRLLVGVTTGKAHGGGFGIAEVVLEGRNDGSPTAAWMVHGHSRGVTGLATLDGSQYITAGKSGSVVVWDAEAKSHVCETQLDYGASCVTYSGSTGIAVVGMLDRNELVLLKVITEKKGSAKLQVESTIQLQEQPQSGKRGSKAAAAMGQSTATIRRQQALETNKAKEVSESSQAAGTAISGCRSLSFSPDGKLLAVGCKDGAIFLLDATAKYTGSAHLEGSNSSVLQIDWSSCGRYMRSADMGGQLLHWEVMPTPRLHPKPHLLRDTEWHSLSCPLGWAVQGVCKWDGYKKGTMEQLYVCAVPEENIAVSGNSQGVVWLQRYPSMLGCQQLEYYGHCQGIGGLVSTRSKTRKRYVISVGGVDGAVLVWSILATSKKDPVAMSLPAARRNSAANEGKPLSVAMPDNGSSSSKTQGKKPNEVPTKEVRGGQKGQNEGEEERKEKEKRNEKEKSKEEEEQREKTEIKPRKAAKADDDDQGRNKGGEGGEKGNDKEKQRQVAEKE
ncbi:unnamed protein product, partial [Chrysoparadoxa australica]